MEAKELDLASNRQLAMSWKNEESMIQEFFTWLDRSKATETAYMKNLRAFYAWKRMENIWEPEYEDILRYRAWLQSTHYAIKLDPASITGWSYQTDRSGRRIRLACKPATVALYLRTLFAFYNWMELRKGIKNITKGIHAPAVYADEGHTRTSLKDDEIRQLLQHMDSNPGSSQQEKEQRARIRAIVLLAVTAGLRTIEISRATIGDLEVRGGRAWLYVWGKHRTDARQRKALATGTYEAIKAYLDLRQDSMRPDSPLFMATGNRSNGGPVLPTTISTWIKRELRAAGYDSERLTAHSLRHTAAMQALQITEKNIYRTQLYMRHRNPKTTEIYLHEDELEGETELADAIFSRISAES